MELRRLVIWSVCLCLIMGTVGLYSSSDPSELRAEEPDGRQSSQDSFDSDPPMALVRGFRTKVAPRLDRTPAALSRDATTCPQSLLVGRLDTPHAKSDFRLSRLHTYCTLLL